LLISKFTLIRCIGDRHFWFSCDYIKCISLKVLPSRLWCPPRCPVNVHRCFGGTYCPHLQDRNINSVRNQQEGSSRGISNCYLVSCALGHRKWRSVRSSETSVNINQSTLFHNSDDNILHSQQRKNLRSNISLLFSGELTVAFKRPNAGWRRRGVRYFYEVWFQRQTLLKTFPLDKSNT
jgi:hypothetical protein